MAMLLLVAACGGDDTPSLAAEELAIFAALPGQAAGVAYLTLRNEAAAPVTLVGVSSPEFASVEMHTTLLDGAMSSMLPLDSLTIAEGAAMEFAPGGPHLMLMQPLDELEPGDVVTLQFHYEHASDGEVSPAAAGGWMLFSVSGPLQTR